MQIIGSNKNESTENSDRQVAVANETIAQKEKPFLSEKESFVTINQAEAKRFLEGLSESLSEIDSFKEYVSNTLTMKLREIENFENSTVKTFNSLVDSVSELKENIKVAGNYEAYLEERISNANLNKEISMLELQLNKEKAEITIMLGEISETVRTSISKMETKVSELKSADILIEDSIQKFSDETHNSFSSYSKEAENKLEETGTRLMAISENQQNAVKIKCEQFLKEYTEKCQSHLEIVKKQSLDFLKQCSDENKKLISKVPSVANGKISKKDIIIYIIAGLTFAGLLLNIFL